MGSYGVDPDYEGIVLHRIVCTSGWRTCNGAHETAAQSKDCWRKVRVMNANPGYGPCTWHVLAYNEDGPYEVECGALMGPLTKDGREIGVQCEAGHSHIDYLLQEELGVAYVEDGTEASYAIHHGLQPLTMAGQVWPR